MITYKTPDQLEVMKIGGQKLGKIRDQLMSEAKVGMKLVEIENSAMKLINECGSLPSFPTVAGYKWATCLCVNDEVVHGIPNNYILSDGDVLTIDIGLIEGGFHTDTAWSKIVLSDKSKPSPEVTNFLKIGETALNRAIAVTINGNHIGHISDAIEQTITKAGFSIVKSLVGHGIGRTLHEDPQIPGFLKIPIVKTPLLTTGMTIAIEVIYAMGKGDVVYDSDDGWTIATRDGQISAVFEHTIAITSNGPLVLTKA
jgi:methionyl aminopeptidase